MRGVTDWLASRARLTPTREAIVEVSTGLRLTYAELNRRVNRLASALQRLGASRGERIALLAPNAVCYLELLFAAAKTGTVFVPLNYRFSVPELTYVLNDCQPFLLVVHDQFADVGHALLPHTNIPNVLSFSEYESLLADGQPESVEPIELDQEDPWAIIYTGGTTGQAKGVVLSHRAITWNSVNTLVSWGLTERDVTAVHLPMFHTGGLNALTTPILHAGGKVVIVRDFDPAKALQVLEEEGCTIALFVPTMHHMLTETPEFAKATFSTMHTFLSGGAPCPLGIYEKYWAKGLAFKEGYGLTEAGPNNFYIHPDDARRKIGSVGMAMFHNQVRIVDDEGRDVPPGETGELWIRGPHVFSGYWNKPEITSETLVDGWLRTGDLARRDEEGYHYIVGRKKDMIISGGENVYPLEVEHVLAEHPGVSEVAVVGLPDPKWGEAVTAVIVPAPGVELTGEQLKAHCKAKLAGYKIPKRFHFVAELPKTSVGKIDKKQIEKGLTHSVG
jgi:fatty-acyl-CoA synthase